MSKLLKHQHTGNPKIDGQKHLDWKLVNESVNLIHSSTFQVLAVNGNDSVAFLYHSTPVQTNQHQLNPEE